MTRLRTIRQTLDMIKANDPDSAITEYFIRTLVADHKIRTLKAGRKFLIDIDSLENFLSGENTS